MRLVIVILTVLIVGVVAVILLNIGGGPAGLALIILDVVFALVVAGTNLSTYVSQIEDIETLKEVKNVEDIYRVKATALTAEFSKYLSVTYPDHEKEIFSKITPESAAVFLVKYPELKASETLMKLVEKINDLQSDIYEQQIKRENMLKNMRTRVRDPFVFASLIPKE